MINNSSFMSSQILHTDASLALEKEGL